MYARDSGFEVRDAVRRRSGAGTQIAAFARRLQIDKV